MSDDFKRVKDPVVEQDDAKLIGALGGGYAGLKSQLGHMNFLNKPGVWETLKSLKSSAVSPLMAPARVLGGAGIGALAAGVLARYVNKNHAKGSGKQGLPPGMSMREVPGSKMRPEPITYTYNPNPVEYTFTPPELEYQQYFAPMNKQSSVKETLLGDLAKAILGK